MKPHKRNVSCAEADYEITKALIKVEERYKLTIAETMRLLAGRLERVARSGVQVERHPDDPEHPADAE